MHVLLLLDFRLVLTLIIMFDLSHEDQQHARDSKPAQLIEDLTEKLGMHNLSEPTTLVNIYNAICEPFGD